MLRYTGSNTLSGFCLHIVEVNINMSATIHEPPAVLVSPRGHLHIHATSALAHVSAAKLKVLEAAFAQGPGLGVLYLGARAIDGTLPPAVDFWRKIGRLFMTQLCMHADPEAQRPQIDLAPPDALLAFADCVPLMPGAEYVDAAFLRGLWHLMLEALRAELADFDGSVQAYIRLHNPVWHALGRVCFHLAENKANPGKPFVFMATYTESLGGGNRPRHLPLAKAVHTYAADPKALARILEPVRRAAAQSALVRRLLESKALFAPQGWSASETYAFLRDVSIFEDSGVQVRVPNWWRQRSRPQATITVGNRQSASLGMDALLDFDVELMLGGERLTHAQWRALARENTGLVQVRGQWVEVDAERLQQALEHLAPTATRQCCGLELCGGDAAACWHAATRPGGRCCCGGRGRYPVVGCQARQVARKLAGEPARRQHLAPAQEGLQATLRPYQQVGTQWLAKLGRLGVGACLADDMGLGKTLQVLALLLMLRGTKRPSLVIVPASLLSNWQQEAQRFAPSLRMGVAHKSADAPVTEAAGVDVVFTTFGMLQRQAWLRDTPWELAVVDEAQAIKNPNSRQTRAVKTLQAKQRIALTGTPVENRAMDLWSIFDFINPGLLGSATAFTRHLKQFEDPKGTGYGPLRKLVQPYIMRRLKTDKSIINDLPEKTEMLAWCGLRRKQAVLYQQSVESLMERLKSADGIERRGLILSYMMRLKQICNHPSQWLRDGGYDRAESGKFTRLAELCDTIVQRQEKVLVFTQYREMTEPLQAYLSDLFGRPGLVLHGGTPVKARQQLVQRFQDDDSVGFFVLSLKAGGSGLNLTAASHVIHFDRLVESSG